MLARCCRVSHNRFDRRNILVNLVGGWSLSALGSVGQGLSLGGMEVSDWGLGSGSLVRLSSFLWGSWVLGRMGKDAWDQVLLVLKVTVRPWALPEILLVSPWRSALARSPERLD